MIIKSFLQGSDAWHAHRATARNASEAGMVMGDSPYGTRADVLHRMATGVLPEVTEWQQKIFDRGHAVEPLLRDYAEKIVNDTLSPICATSDDGYLSCSFDGVTFMGDVNAEFKQYNQDKIADIEGGRLPLVDKWQVVQGFAVNEEAQVCIYVCGDGTPENTRHLFVNRVDLERDIERLRPGWELLDQDRASYVVEPKRAASVGAAPAALPALRIEVVGQVSSSNLEEWRAAAMAKIDGLNRNLQTDQDFADAVETVKFLHDAERTLKAELDRALNSAEDIERLRRVGGDVLKRMADVRLEINRLVEAEKVNRKVELIDKHVESLRQHVETLNKGLGEYALTFHKDWPGILGQQLKGMRSFDAMDAKLGEYVARGKVEHSEDAEDARANAALFAGLEPRYVALFPDRVKLAQEMRPNVCRDTVDARIARFDAQERERLEAERLRIRAEEEARVQAEAAPAAAQQEKSNVVPAVDLGVVGVAQDVGAVAAPAPAAPVSNQAPHAAQAPAPAVIKAPLPAASAPLSNEPTLNLGAINKRLAPLSISGAGLAELSIEPLATEKNSKLYSEAQFMTLLNELVDHLSRIGAKAHREQLEAA